MTTRALIFGLGLAALGCRMDNPAFDLERDSGVADDSDDDPTEPTDSEESVGNDQGDGDGDGDGDESSSEDGPDETTAGDCLAGASCGPCQICDPSGECVIDVGGPCDGAQTHCADFLFGADESTCYRLTDVTLGGRCSEQGLCEPPPAIECPSEAGAVHFACDPACVTNFEGCTKYGKASEVELAAMCSTGGQDGPECKSVCANGIESVIQQHGCVEGECQPLGVAEFCEAYACDEQGVTCLDSCETDAHCAQQFTCLGSQCVPG